MKRLFITILLLSIYVSVEEDTGVDSNPEDQLKELGIVEEDQNSNFYKDLLKKKKEEEHKNHIKDLQEEGIEVDEEEDEESLQENSWLYQNKSNLMKIVVVTLVTVLVILIGWKMYSLQQQIKSQKSQMAEYSEQMEKIIDDSDNLVSVSWKDQKEGIVFVENPSYKQKVEKNLSKKEQLENEIKNLQYEITTRTEEIEKLKEKEDKYLDEIQNLKAEYNENKKKVLDEGHALGFADTVLREFR